MTRPWLKLVKRFAEFSASSLLGTIVDTVVLWVFSKWVFSTYFGQYIVSPAISFECAAVTNFVVAYFLIWKDRVSRRTARSFSVTWAATIYPASGRSWSRWPSCF